MRYSEWQRRICMCAASTMLKGEASGETQVFFDADDEDPMAIGYAEAKFKRLRQN